MKQADGARARQYITLFCALTLIIALVYSAAPLINPPDEGGDVRANAPAQAGSADEADEMQRFMNARADVRRLEMLELNAVAADEAADESVRAEARRQLITLSMLMEQEVTLEGVLRLRGFKDALVTVHPDSVNVIVRAETLSQSDCAAILELVMRETGITGGNVKIMKSGE